MDKMDEKAARRTLVVIDAIKDLNGRPPTLREVAISADRPLGTVRGWLLRLRDRGLVAWAPRSSRTLRLTPKGRVTIGLPAVVVRLADFGPDPVVRLYQ